MKFETVRKDGIQGKIESLERSIKTEEEMEEELLEIINTRIGNPSFCMNQLRWIYEFKAQLELLKYQNVDKFKENVFISGKLYLMSRREINYFITGDYTKIFPIIMSNNVEMRNFLVKNMNEILYEKNIKEYAMTGMSGLRFLNKNILLALKGDFEQLKERSEKFIEKSPKTHKKRIIDHEFYIALCDGNIEEMQKIIYRMLEKKTAKVMLYDIEVFFSDFLHIQALLFSKIALLHGYNLEIDHVNAHKELIDNTPLAEYPEPYEFMKKFRFDFTIADWSRYLINTKSRGRRIEI